MLTMICSATIYLSLPCPPPPPPPPPPPSAVLSSIVPLLFDIVRSLLLVSLLPPVLLQYQHQSCAMPLHQSIVIAVAFDKPRCDCYSLPTARVEWIKSSLMITTTMTMTMTMMMAMMMMAILLQRLLTAVASLCDGTLGSNAPIQCSLYRAAYHDVPCSFARRSARILWCNGAKNLCLKN
jgi:hypothetical protein